ncbi:type II secretion system protein GspL [Psychromonas sp. CD1]|uniref:type II secretion system protein GspL n=1 Tax=Psychromonas sp. CD1 TaxID=1979839 RepID=UPI000B9BD79D|nr:type II secretion system protein GspL [Psychromonas sp. CD1]
MTEQLIIRLASESTQKNHWLIWSETENEIIASGEVDDALQLNLLTEKAQNRLVICLLPGVDVNIRAVPIKGKYNRHIQQALPYLLEDDLATDVEKLHFNVFSKERDLIHVAYCTQKKMHMWLHWLSEAQLNCLQMIPEGLVLPIAEEGHWSAIELGEQVIVRENKEIAWSCDRCMLSIILESKAQEKLDDDDLIKIDTYSASLSFLFVFMCCR